MSPSPSTAHGAHRSPPTTEHRFSIPEKGNGPALPVGSAGTPAVGGRRRPRSWWRCPGRPAPASISPEYANCGTNAIIPVLLGGTLEGEEHSVNQYKVVPGPGLVEIGWSAVGDQVAEHGGTLDRPDRFWIDQTKTGGAAR